MASKATKQPESTDGDNRRPQSFRVRLCRVERPLQADGAGRPSRLPPVLPVGVVIALIVAFGLAAACLTARQLSANRMVVVAATAAKAPPVIFRTIVTAVGRDHACAAV